MPVLYEKRGSIGIVTLSRPKNRNAWAPYFYNSIEEYFTEMEADDEICCAILTSNCRVFIVLRRVHLPRLPRRSFL